MPHKRKKYILLIGDIIIFYLSLFSALLIRNSFYFTKEIWYKYLTPFTIILIFFVFLFYISNLYKLEYKPNSSVFFRLIINNFLIGSLFSIIIFYFFPDLINTTNYKITPKASLFIFFIVFFLNFYIWRFLYYFLFSTYLPKENLLFINLNKYSGQLIKKIQDNPQLGFVATLIFCSKEEESKLSNNQIPIFNNLEDLEKNIKKYKINTLVLSSKLENSQKLRDKLFKCLNLDITYITWQRFYEIIMEKIPIETINQIWFFENINKKKKKQFIFFKKIYDFLLAIIIFTITFPIWILIAIIIKIDSRGKVFFHQNRVGEKKQIFKLIKFRTMQEKDNDGGPTKENDPRITNIGKFLRKTRLDELPQIINIIKGDMSFVGPRPERPKIINELTKKIPFYNERMLIKPGLTGLDQISGEYHSPSTEDTLEKLKYDFFYIKNQSLYLDFSILLKTILIIIKAKGR